MKFIPNIARNVFKRVNLFLSFMSTIDNFSFLSKELSVIWIIYLISEGKIIYFATRSNLFSISSLVNLN